MYADRVTVYRQQAVKDDDGADDYTMQAVYQELPCHLTQYGKEMQSGQNPREFFTKTDLRICLDPEYDILPNDVLVIVHVGQTFTLNAAKAFKYPDHQEISVRRVAPFTGAWIEIPQNHDSFQGLQRSHPSRVRGLKFYW